MGVTPRHGHAPAASVNVDAWQPPAPARKVWSEDDEEAASRQQGHSFCTRFKFAVWVSIVALLVSAVVGLSITMVVLDKNKGGSSTGPSTPDDPEGGSGAGSGGSSGNTDALPVPPPAPFTVPAGNQAIWFDEFDGSSLDTSKWGYDLGNGNWGWGNNESQMYTKSADNVRVADGLLYLTGLSDGGAYTSGRINTKYTASFYPGMQLEDGTSFTSVHIEARMRLPTPGQGLWPAFWMFPTDPAYGVWAASGEIDIMESTNSFEQITQGLQFGGSDPENVKSMVRTRQRDRSPYSDGFHTFALDWSLGKIMLSVDGEEAQTFLPREKDPEGGWWTSAASTSPNAPFDQPFYIIMNLAIGGLWPKYPDATTPFPATLAVDYVRVWGTPL